MGRRIQITKNREEDFVKMDSLHYLADQHALGILSFTNNDGGWQVSYLDRKKYAVHEPKREECRDGVDYDLRVEQALYISILRSKTYPKFQDMVMGEIQRLKSLPL